MHEADDRERGGAVPVSPQSGGVLDLSGHDPIRLDDETPVRVEDMGQDQNVFGTVGRATDYFALPTYRPGQRELIEEIERAYEQGFRYVVVQAPTGSGKSQIARAFAKQSGSAYILTPTKILQDQYDRDFQNDMEIMKGRNAYTAFYQEKSDDMPEDAVVTCADCICRKKKVDTASCPYRLAKQKALGSPVVVHNFDSFLYQNLGLPWPGRELMIIDECHATESKVAGFMEFSISSRFIPGLYIPKYDTLDEYASFFRELASSLKKTISDLSDIRETGMLNGTQVRLLDRLTNLSSKLERFIRQQDSGNPPEYVFDYQEDFGYQTLKIRPVFGCDYAERLLFDYGRRVLMMSATILDIDQFCDNVGLNVDEVCYIEGESFFPVENNKIVYKGVGKMNFKSIDRTLPHIVEEIENILMRFPSKRGIIQTHSEKIAEYIRENVTISEVAERLTFNKDFPDAFETLKFHAEKPGSVIVASGLREGVDLRGDLSQLQIFCKIPYPSLGDKQVSRRKDLDSGWYGYQTTLSFVQAVGRSIRSENDRAVTYILDSGFGYFYHQNKHYIPDHIRKAIVWK